MKAAMSKYSGWTTQTDPAVLDTTYTDMLVRSGFNILGQISYHFQPQGFTKLFLLGESHLAIHTFPEEGKSYVELTSCNEEMYNRFMSYKNDEKWVVE